MKVFGPIGTLITMQGARAKGGRFLKVEDLSVIIDGALVVDDQKGKIRWCGAFNDLPPRYKKLKKISLKSEIVMPGLIDSHTHLVFAGDRSLEFEMRLSGKTYQEIAQAGGGILKTMNATREYSEGDLLKLAISRAKAFVAQGITTFEVKTGYGLSFEAEKKLLSVIEKLKKKTPATIFSTFMAAHAVPPEYRGRRQEYVEEIVQNWLPRLKSKADALDIFLDDGYFDEKDAEVLLTAALKHKLKLKLHADELKLTGGTETAVKFEALSADHLLQIEDAQVALLSKSEVTATLLPTTAFFLKTNYAPARKLLDAGARVALASDFNPGTSPTQDISLVAILAALQMRMEIHEILAALTINGAYALALQDSKGALAQGYDADFICFRAESPAALVYNFGRPVLPLQIFIGGRKVSA